VLGVRSFGSWHVTTRRDTILDHVAEDTKVRTALPNPLIVTCRAIASAPPLKTTASQASP
jgi:hypothetical protein